MTLIEDIVTQEGARSDKYAQKHKRVAKTLDTNPVTLGKWLIITWTLLTLGCHFITSGMLFFPAYEFAFSYYLIDHWTVYAWSLWFITGISPFVGAIFILFGWTDLFKSTLRHSTNYQRGAFFMYWTAIIITYTVVTIRSAYIYEHFAGLGIPSAWVNFYAIEAYNVLGRDCLIFFVLLQVLCMLSVYNWVNSYKTTLWNFFNLYELKTRIKDSMEYGFDVADSRLLRNDVVTEMVDLSE